MQESSEKQPVSNRVNPRDIQWRNTSFKNILSVDRNTVVSLE